MSSTTPSALVEAELARHARELAEARLHEGQAPGRARDQRLAFADGLGVAIERRERASRSLPKSRARL